MTTSPDEQVKGAQQKISKLIRQKLNSCYGSSQTSPPIAPRNLSMYAEASTTKVLSPQDSASPFSPQREGVSGCWLCGSMQLPFVDHRLNLLFSHSVNFPALPAAEQQTVTSSRVAKMNRHERKAKKNGFDLVEDADDVRDDASPTTPYQPSPDIDLNTMTLCMSCFRLCYNAFSRPALLQDKDASNTRERLSKRIRRLAYSLSVPQEGSANPFDDTVNARTANNGAPPNSGKADQKVPTVVSPKLEETSPDSFADQTSAEVVLPLGASFAGGSLSMTLGASQTRRQPSLSNIPHGSTNLGANKDVTSPKVAQAPLLMEIDQAKTPLVRHHSTENFVLVPYVNTIGNFLLTEEVLGETEKHEGLLTPDRKMGGSAKESGAKSPIILGAGMGAVKAFDASHSSQSQVPTNTPVPTYAQIAKTAPTITISSPPTSPPQSGSNSEPVTTGKVISKGQVGSKPTECIFCGEAVHKGRAPTPCVAFHPNDYLHKVWECPGCTSEMTVQLPQCVVCRRDAPRFDKMVTGAIVPGQNLPPKEAAQDPLEDNPTRCIDELLLNIGATRQAQQGDGNCLFRSLSHQLFGTECHALVRQLCCDFIEEHRDDYEPLVAAMSAGGVSSQPSSFSNRLRGKSQELDSSQYQYSPSPAMSEEEKMFRQYVTQMRRAGTWGDELCVHAAARLFNVRIHVLTSDYPKSRWHLVFQPEQLPDISIVPTNTTHSPTNNQTKSKDDYEMNDNANTLQTCNLPSAPPTSGPTQRILSEFDDCSLPAANADTTQAMNSAAPPNTVPNPHLQPTLQNPILPQQRSDVADIFLLYLRPVHYDDIATPPVLPSTMMQLVETLQKELNFENGYCEVVAAQ